MSLNSKIISNIEQGAHIYTGYLGAYRCRLCGAKFLTIVGRADCNTILQRRIQIFKISGIANVD